MSKDLAIAGVMVISCLVVSAIAFIPPSEKAKPPPKGSALVAKPPAPQLPTTPTVATLTPPEQPRLDPIPTTPNSSAFDPGRTAFDPAPVKPASTTFAPTPSTFAPSPTTRPALPAIDPVPTATKTDEPKTHVVASGEMLGDISLKYYGTSKKWRAIQEANPGLDPDRLLVGQKITIPALKESPKPADAAKTAAPAAPELAPGERSYTVKEGDRYYTIAQRELGDASRYKELETLNKTPGEELRVGQVIKLPAKKDVVAPVVGDKPKADATPAIDDGKKRHTVAEGDTLGDISTKYYGTSKRWHDIAAANPGIDPDKLVVGQKLVIPDAPAEAPKTDAKPKSDTKAKPGEAKPKTDLALDKPKPESAAKPADGGDTVEYVVKAGDGSLYAIAEHLYKRKATVADVEKIQKANPGLDAHNLRVGQKLKVPGVKSDKPEAAPAAKPAAPANPFAPGSNPFAPDAVKPTTLPPKPAAPATTPPNPFATPAQPTQPTQPFGARPPGAPAAPTTSPTAPKPAAATPPAVSKPFDTPPSPAPAANPATKGDPANDPFKDFFARP